jgi:hypothetical protein
MGRAWWCSPVIPALRRLRKDDISLLARLGYFSEILSQTKQQQQQK